MAGNSPEVGDPSRDTVVTMVDHDNDRSRDDAPDAPRPPHPVSPTEPSDRPRYDGGLDYWNFVEHVRSRLAVESPDSDHAATAVILALVRGATTFSNTMESTIHRPAGRSWAGYQLLYTLWLAGDMYPSEAATLTGTSRAAVSGLTAKMTDEGLLTKIPAPEDGRSHLLHLTERGVEEARTLYERQNVQETRWADALTREERSILLILMDKLLSGTAASEARQRR
jgi:MarR family transcriptional repressor of emrRAB